MLVGGVIAAVAGWFLREITARFGWALLVLGPLGAILGAPSFFRDRVVVDDSKFSMRSGIWGLTSTHEVVYADLQRVRATSEESVGRRGRRKTNYFCSANERTARPRKFP